MKDLKDVDDVDILLIALSGCLLLFFDVCCLILPFFI